MTGMIRPRSERAERTEGLVLVICPSCNRSDYVNTEYYNGRIQYVEYKCCNIIRCYNLAEGMKLL